MIDPEQEFEQKCEQIEMEIEMLVLEGIIAALRRLSYNLRIDELKATGTSADIEPF